MVSSRAQPAFDRTSHGALEWRASSPGFRRSSPGGASNSRRPEAEAKSYWLWGDAATRKPGPDGKLPPVGSTVDVANATWSDSIGDASLAAVWKDPDFDAKEQAFYYVRVLEIPTPRWTAYDAKRFGTKLAAKIPTQLQERAYTSPIWYAPK